MPTPRDRLITVLMQAPPENNKAGAKYRMIFRQPGCLSRTLRLSAPSLRMVEYCRLSLQIYCIATMSPRICQQLSIILFTGLPVRRRGVGGHDRLRAVEAVGPDPCTGSPPKIGGHSTVLLSVKSRGNLYYVPGIP